MPERLQVCFIPLVVAERRRKRNLLLDFRSMKSLWAVRPVFHWKERRVRAHLPTCRLAFEVF